MSGGGGSAPKPDPNIGIAALKASETGERYLAFMEDQAAITNEWAAQDRVRYQDTFIPLEDRFIAEAQGYDSPERKAKAATEAVADVRQQQMIAQAGNERRMASMGVNPASGRFAGEERRADTAGALAAAGAANTARRQVEATGDAMRANAINLGKGLAVNPGTAMGLSNGAASSGFSGAMQGYQTQGSLLNTQFQQQMDVYNAKQAQQGMLGQAVGSVVGALAFGSSEKIKTDKRKAPGVLDAVKEMRVEKWRYKPGEGDGKEHVGPYAEEFKAKTGLGDGKSISVIDAVGVTMGAVKELADKVDRMDKKGAKA